MYFEYFKYKIPSLKVFDYKSHLIIFYIQNMYLVIKYIFQNSYTYFEISFI